MHNLIAKEQMAEWSVDHTDDEMDLINDYFDCLIECSIEQHPHECKRICRDTW